MATQLNRRSFNDLQSIRKSDSGFSIAKKMAALAIKSNVNPKGKTTAKGYQDAMSIVDQFRYSSNEKESLDAQNAYQTYENALTKMQYSDAQVKRSVAQFKMDERDIFYVTPGSGADDLMSDIPGMVDEVANELAAHNLEVQRAIDEKQASGEDSSDLEAYLWESQKRLNAITELNNDLLTGDITPGKQLSSVGLYVDTDPEDGQVRGVGVFPTGNLPYGFSADDFKQVEASDSIGGGYLPVYGTATKNQWGESQVRIGGKVWSGTGTAPLTYDNKESDDPNYKGTDGTFTLKNVPLKGQAVNPGRYFKGYVGFDENDNPKLQYFYAGKDGSVYSLSNQDLLSLKNDPTQSKAIGSATIVANTFAKQLSQSTSTKPYDAAPKQEIASVPTTPTTNGAPQQQNEGFFAKAANFVGGLFKKPSGTPQPGSVAGSTPSFFGGQQSTSPSAIKTPQEVGGAASGADIIQGGQSFFRNQ